MSRIRITSFSPAFEPEVATRKSSSRALKLGAEGAVLRLPLLRDVERREDLEDVDHGVAGRPVERLGGVEDAVDPVADRELLAGRLEVDVGRPPQHRVVDQFLGRHVRPRLLGLRTRVGSSLAVPGVLPMNVIGGPARSTGPTSRLKRGFMPSFIISLVDDFAQVVGRQHLGVVGHGLVPHVDVREQRHEVRQQEQDEAERVDRDRPEQHQAEHPREEDDGVPELEPEVVQLLGVVVDPGGGPGPEQVDEHHRDELEEIQVEAGPRTMGGD